jgi:hypothetical protein
VAGQHTREVLDDWEIDADRIDRLFESGTLGAVRVAPR